MHECLLCKRDMKVSDGVFGNGCVRNIYTFLDFKMPKKVSLREETLYKNIMKMNNINSLNKNQKIWLTDRYLTYQYLNRIPYGDYNAIKNQINYDIQNIKQIKTDKEPKSAKNMSLKQAYDLYKKVMKFQNGIDKISKGNFTDEDSIKTIITSIGFIFNISKNKKQYENNAFKGMQFALKKDDKWNLDIKIHDTYDYSKAKNLFQYYNDTNSIPKSILSSSLYNLAAFSNYCKVIKIYDIDIEFTINDYQ